MYSRSSPPFLTPAIWPEIEAAISPKQPYANSHFRHTLIAGASRPERSSAAADTDNALVWTEQLASSFLSQLLYLALGFRLLGGCGQDQN